MLFACVLFAVMALAAKQAMRELPWHEVAAGRAGFGALTIYVFARSRAIPLMVHDRRAQWSRTGAGVLAMCFGFYAMSRLPLGDAVTLGNLSPLMLAIISPRLLGERAGAGLGMAIVLGFVGVAVLAGAQLHSHGALVAIGSAVVGALCSCMAMIFLRRLGPSESAEGVSLHFAIWAAVATFLLGLGRHVVPSTGALLSLALAGFTGGAAQVAMTKAYGLDKAARVGAIGYSGVVFAQILGVLVLHEYPSVRQLAGAALVVCSGLLLVSGALREGDAQRPTPSS
jgi:drug/metabolite transporter (DMT)-like permease